MKRLQTVIPIDVSFFSTIDPATLLFTGVVVDDILLRASSQFLENEYLQNDVNKCAWMARSNTPVMNLVQATQGELERSQRYREILAPLALGDELRAALITGGSCWGFLCLHREFSSPHFTLTEAAYLARLTPHLAEEGPHGHILIDTLVCEEGDEFLRHNERGSHRRPLFDEPR